MADEMVTLRIRVVGKPQDIKKFTKEVTQLGAASKLTSSRIQSTSTAMGGLNNRIKQWNKQHPLLSKGLGVLIGLFDKLGKLVVKLGTIGFAVILASLSALTGAFALGNLAVKAYRISMAALAGVVASAIAAIAAFAAAQRELNAATNAYTNKSAPALGSAFNQSRAALRGLQSDAQLASAGMEALNATFAAVSKNASFDAKATKALRALDDFASAGGDRGKNLAAAGEFYGLLQKGISSGKLGLTAEIEAAGKAISPAFEKGLKEFKKKGGRKDLVGLQDAILGGQLAAMAGVEDQARAVNETLINVLKGYFTRLQSIFADLGQPLLLPLKKAAEDIFKIIRDTLLRIAPDVQAFGSGSLIQGLINGFQKIADFFVKLMREYLPKTQGMLQSFGNWWKKFVTGWNELNRRLQGAVQAGREVNRIFGPVLMDAFRRLGDMFKTTQDLIAKNEGKFQSLANAIRNILQLVSNMYTWFAEALVEAAPALEAITSAFLKIADAIGMVLEGLQNIASFIIPGGAGSALGGLAQIAALMFGGGMLKQFAKGGFAGGVGNAARNTGVGKVVTGATQVGKGAANAAGAGATAAGRGAGRIITPFTSGYSRGRSQGQGVMGSIGRGARGTYMSTTGGGASRGAGRIITNMTGGKGVGGAMGVGKGMKGLGGRMLGGGGMGGMLGGAAVGLGGNFLVERGVLDESTRGGIGVGSLALGLGASPMLAAGLGLGKAAWDSKTAGGGALLGAGSGAAIGAMAGGPVGAVIGAAIGGVAGAIKGWWNKDKAERKKAKDSASQLVGGFASDVLGGMILGGGKAQDALGKMSKKGYLYSQFEGLNQTQRKVKAASMGLTGSDLQTVTQEHFGTYMKEFNKQSKTLEDAARGPLKTYNNRMGELTKMTGKGRDEIHKLAMENGVNLYDSTVDLATAMDKLGLSVDTTVEGIIGASRDLSIKAMGVFDKVILYAESEKIIDEAAEELRQLGQGAQKEDFAKFSRTAYEQLQIMNPGASEFELLDKFNKSFGMGGTAYTQAGGPLEGLQNRAIASGGMALNTEFYNTAMTEQRGLLADQLVTSLGRQNLSVDKSALMSQLGGMSADQLANLQNAVATGDFSSFTGIPKKMTADTQAEGALSKFGVQGVEVVKMAQTLPEQLSIEAEKLRAEIVAGITEGFSNTPEWMKTPPEWFNKESFKALVEGDTKTPRGNVIGDSRAPKALGRTMARHNYFDSMVTGRRSVTSSFRTHSLGSINSDHVTGRAYDLTGQNLGMYASAVKGAGGFAEFHGIGGNRHLHVVPGPTPIGDMSTPRMTSTPSPMASSGGDSVTINVYGAAGQDESVIAQKVMSMLDKRQRSVRERM